MNEKAIEAAAKAMWELADDEVGWESAKADPKMQSHTEWELENARRAIAAYEKAMWRPIEEAPKDGTPIQVTHLPFTGRPPFNAVRWSHGPQKSQWRWRILGYERSPLRYTPTHFHHLPKPEGI